MGNEFGNWLADQLVRRELTKSDFARAIDRSPSRVSEWTSGRRIPDPDSCDLIADALHVDLDVVLAKAGHRPLPERVDPDDPKLEIYGLVDQIDWEIPGNVRIVRAMLRELVRETKRRQADEQAARGSGDGGGHGDGVATGFGTGRQP